MAYPAIIYDGYKLLMNLRINIYTKDLRHIRYPRRGVMNKFAWNKDQILALFGAALFQLALVGTLVNASGVLLSRVLEIPVGPT